MKKAAKGQRRLRLRNNYLALIISMLLFGSAFGQARITYTPMNQAGYSFNYTRHDSGLALPFRNLTIGRGTTRPGPVIINIADTGFYYYNGIDFIRLDGKVDSVTSSGNNVCQWKRGVPTCYLINTGGGTFTAVDSLTYVGNSICWWKNGVPTCYSLIPGVDSVTVVGSLLCQWVNGTPTCFTINGDVLGSGIDSVTVIGTQLCQWTAGVSTCYTINNVGVGIDSITVVDTTMCTWSGGVSTCFPIGRRTIVYVKKPLRVDSTSNPGYQTLSELHADGLVSGGIVTKSDCWKIDVTPPDYWLNYNNYIVGQALGLDVDTADVSNPRYDIVLVDSFGVISVRTGTPSATPIAPSHNIGSEIVLATIYIPAGASCLDIIVKMIYNENLGTAGGEFNATSAGTIAQDYANTANPFIGSIAGYTLTHADGATLIFTDNVTDSIIPGMIIKGAIYINGLQSISQWFKLQFFMNSVAVSDQQFVSSADGLNSLDSSNYQVFAKPTSPFTFSSKYFNKVVATLAGDDLSGARGFYTDWLQLQWGLPATTKTYVDSVKNVSSRLVYYKNGIPYDGGSISAGATGVTNVATGYGLSGGPITSTGTIIVDSATLHLKFVAFTDTALMLAPYLRKIDTTGKWVNNVIKVNDSTIRVLKGSGATDLLIRGNGAGGNQSFQQVTTVDSLSNHNVIFSADTSKNSITVRDSIGTKLNFSPFAAGLKGIKLREFRTEKYNQTFDGIGFMGAWQEYLIRNYYNAGNRPGEIYSFGYNINSGGSAAISNEGAFAWTMESDFNRTFESYWTVVKKDGSNYRPLFIRAWKDTSLNDITLKGSVFHINPIDTAADYFNMKNGHLILARVPNMPADVSSTTFEITTGTKTIAEINNGASLLWGQADSYIFQNTAAGASKSAQIQLQSDVNSAYIYRTSSTYSGLTPNALYIQNQGADIVLLTGSERLRIANSTGNVSIGSAAAGTALFNVGTSDQFQVASTGIIKSNKMLKATGTPTVVTHQTDSTLSQMSLTDLATALGGISVTAVDSMYRTPGKDSIQFSIAGRYHAIKDSVGLTSIDTTNISNFSVKVRSLISVTSPITYNSATGALAITAMDATHSGYVAAGTNANKVLHGDGTWKDTTASGGSLAGATGDIISFSGTNTASNINAVAIGSLFASAGTSTKPVWSASPTLTTSLTVPTLYGSASSGGTLTLQSTSHATKGKILFGTSAYDEVNNRLGIGTTSPSWPIQVSINSNAAAQMLFNNANSGPGAYSGIQLQSNSGSSYIYLTSSGYSGGTANELFFQQAVTGGGITFITPGFTTMRMLAGLTYFGAGTAATSTVQIGGSFATAYVAKATSYTATVAEHTINVTATGQTITLPTAVGITGREYTIKLTAAGSATVNTTSSEAIDGSTTYSLSAQYKYVTVQSTGAGWMIIANN